MIAWSCSATAAGTSLPGRATLIVRISAAYRFGHRCDRRFQPLQRIYYAPADELVGQPISSLIELPEGFLVCDDIRLTKKTELTRAGPGASEIYEIELRQLRVGDRVAAGFLLVMHNITEQKNTEANIRRNIALLEAAIQSSTNGVIVIDSDLSVVLYNRRLSAILELPERWEQMTDTEKINELAYCYQEPQLLYNEIEELIKNPADQRLTTFETIRGRALDCFISPYQVGQEKPGWLFSYQDVTEQKVAEDKLRHLPSPIHSRMYSTAGTFSPWHRLS